MILWLLACTDINDDDLLVPPDTSDTGEAIDVLPPGPERLLVANGKLSSKQAGYTLNEEVGGRWVGASLYTYDPSARGELAELGRLDLGPTDPDFDQAGLSLREIATAPDGAVWVLLIDQGVNDEWTLGRVGADLSVTPYVLSPEDGAAYTADELTGMAFSATGDLLLCSAAQGAFPGALLTLSMPPAYADEVDRYYAAPMLASAVELPGNLGCAGDLVPTHALVRKGNDFARTWLFDLAAGAEVGAGLATDPTDAVEGLATVNFATLALGIEGDVWRVDPATGAFSWYDAVALPPDDLGQPTMRFRGAATVRVP